MAEGINIQKDDGTWLNAGYAGFALLIGIVAWNLFDTLGVQFGWADRYDEWYPLAKNAASFVFGLGSWLAVKADKERHQYFLSSISELRKVSWPSAEDTRRMTIVVVVVVGVFAAILALFDMVWGNILGMLF
jgi:preprotein translocase SecE subunit